ncbi:MAG: tail fiber domain-containing protein [Minisyncoccia bacterium]
MVGIAFTTLDFRGAGIGAISPDPIDSNTVIINIEGGKDIDEVGSANQVLYKNAFNLAAGSANLTFNGTNLVCGGTVTANSDKKLKKNIKPIENALEKTLLLNGVEFDFVNRNESSIGFIAQEVQKIVPQLVFGGDNENELMSIAYQNFVALLVEAIKEQQNQINELRNEVKSLKSNKYIKD